MRTKVFYKTANTAFSCTKLAQPLENSFCRNSLYKLCYIYLFCKIFPQSFASHFHNRPMHNNSDGFYQIVSCNLNNQYGLIGLFCWFGWASLIGWVCSVWLSKSFCWFYWYGLFCLVWFHFVGFVWSVGFGLLWFVLVLKLDSSFISFSSTSILMLVLTRVQSLIWLVWLG